MKLSLIMPSHNVGPRVQLNILNVCSMAGPEVEVVVRENSGNAEKRSFLSAINHPGCRILTVDECPGRENTGKLIEEGRGDFLFFMADDDQANPFAIPTILDEIERIGSDPSVSSINGLIVVDDEPGSPLAEFSRLADADPSNRLRAFVLHGWHSVFQYAPVRREVLQSIWRFSATLPVYVCYHDLLMNLLVLMHGRTVQVPRYLYHYYNANWRTPEQHILSEAHSFRHAGLDLSAVRVMWLIAAFEGAQTILRKYPAALMPEGKRIEMAEIWFWHWYTRFTTTANRQVPGALHDRQAIRLAEKWLAPPRPFYPLTVLPSILADVAEYYSLSSPELGRQYFEFWR